MMAVDQILSELNQHQQAAVLHQTGPAMVLAGAGSGKTKVLTTRVAWLIKEQGIDPSEILLVTFTNKAAGEMRHRVTQLTGSELPFSGTFHSLCARILRREGYLLGLPAGFSIYDTDDQISLIKKIYKQHGFSTKEFNPKAVKAKISTAKNELITWPKYQEVAYGAFQEHTAKIYKLYQHALDESGAVDFDDLMLKVLELFEKNPEVLAKYQQQIKHVLVDEYQDTNKAQYQLTRVFSYPQENVYVVGDFSQSIYAWRGADYRNMMSLKTDFPQIKEYRLEQNYRSTQTILDAATQVISQNTMHPILHLWTEKSASQKLILYEARDSLDEAQTVVNYIRDHRTEYLLSDTAILYRTNAQSRQFEEVFVRAGIPYRVVGGMKFYERKEIKDILAYLKLVVNNQDSVSQTRAEKLGKRRFDQFIAWKQENVSEKTIPHLEPGPLLQEILEITQYSDKYDPKDTDDQSRLENIQELLNVAHQFDNTLQFLENIALIQNDELLDRPADEQNVVTLMSLHAAKGLEFPVIFMVGMEDGLLPHSRSLFDKEQMEEERRLCYVGITRAKDHLYFTYARSRTSYQGTSNNLRSRFLGDIAENLLTKQGGGGNYQTSNKGRHYVPLDDETLDGVLSGDFDIEAFLDS